VRFSPPRQVFFFGGVGFPSFFLVRPARRPRRRGPRKKIGKPSTSPRLKLGPHFTDAPYYDSSFSADEQVSLVFSSTHVSTIRFRPIFTRFALTPFPGSFPFHSQRSLYQRPPFSLSMGLLYIWEVRPPLNPRSGPPGVYVPPLR